MRMLVKLKKVWEEATEEEEEEEEDEEEKKKKKEEEKEKKEVCDKFVDDMRGRMGRGSLEPRATGKAIWAIPKNDSWLTPTSLLP